MTCIVSPFLSDLARWVRSQDQKSFNCTNLFTSGIFQSFERFILLENTISNRMKLSGLIAWKNMMNQKICSDKRIKSIQFARRRMDSFCGNQNQRYKIFDVRKVLTSEIFPHAQIQGHLPEISDSVKLCLSDGSEHNCSQHTLTFVVSKFYGSGRNFSVSHLLSQ